jgi:MerR family mercuric resistance operon transcriptional regulator
MQDDERYLIGELAERVGVNRETLRYYERRGLLKPARRTAAGYRIYDRASAARLRFIKRAQGFGFSLEEIRDLLRMKPENPRSCNQVMTMLDGKLEHLAAQIQEMEHFHQQLTGYRKQCDEALAEGECCPVILTVARSAEIESEKS